MAEPILKRLGIGRRRREPPRETMPTPGFILPGQVRPNQRTVWKPTPRNLRFFSKSVYARRAINAVKNPIAMLDWEIRPAKGVKASRELARQIEIATYCLANPNADDSFRSLIEQVLEDTLIGAGAIETQPGSDPMRPLWMWPVDGLSIQIYPAWTGDRREARYVQSVGANAYASSGPSIQLRDDELIYIRPNPSTATPFGLGPLEVAFNSISRQLGVAEFSGNVTSNAKPSAMINLGEGVDTTALALFRSYWTTEVEGQGKTPIVGGKGAEVMKLYPDGDDALYLRYQEFLKVEIATAFDLSPQNLGVERDVNRSTGEVSQERDWEHAIKPRATELAAYLTRKALHQRLGFYQLEFAFIGLDREDEKLAAQVYAIEYAAGATFPDEYRETRGRAPLNTAWSQMTGVDRDMAKAAAAGVKQVFDPNLPAGPDKPPVDPAKE